MRNLRAHLPVALWRHARVHLALEVSAVKKRATESGEEHDEERDHGRDEKGVQTPAAGTRSGLTLDICGRGHIQKQRYYPAAARGVYVDKSSRLSKGRHHVEMVLCLFF